MLEAFDFWLGILIVLIAYLCMSVGRRLLAEKAKQWGHEEQLPPTVFDASAIAPQIQRIRQDYVAALHSQPHRTSYRIGLIASTRRLVAGLPYFHRLRSEHEMEKHDA